MINQQDVSEHWTDITGKPPVQGDLLPVDDFLYQFRTGLWCHVCKLDQGDGDGQLLWEVAGSEVSADVPNLIAVMVDIARNDKRVSLEDLVASVMKIIRAGGWTNPITKVNGRVIVQRPGDEAISYLVGNFGSVQEQLLCGENRICLETDTGTVFVNVDSCLSVTCQQIEGDD